LCRRRRRRRKSIFHDESNKRYPLNTLVSSLLLSYNN
jgi:hypothetical protein